MSCRLTLCRISKVLLPSRPGEGYLEVKEVAQVHVTVNVEVGAFAAGGDRAPR